jgi:hypothetical protein
MDLPPIDYLERFWGLMLRPHLHVEHSGVRRVETVAVSYTALRQSLFTPPGSSAHGESISGISPNHARYIRAWVFNDWLWCPAARNCQVFVEAIWLNNRLVDDERSPLHWTDLNSAYSFPSMRRGYKNGHYIDVCAADSVDNRFQVISQKWTKGYHRFHQSGVYRLQLCAEALWPSSFSHFALTVGYDNRRWNDLHVISARETRRWMPW